MLFLAGLFLCLQLALPAPSQGLVFNFTQVEQCEPAVVFFSGQNITASPSTLVIVPFNSSAIFVPLQSPSLLKTGISLSLLPFPARSNFVASLEDGKGESLISTSDIIRVFPSPTQNSSCLHPDANVPRHFSLVSTVTQCEDMVINYNPLVVSKAPIVRLYSPRGPSFLLNLTSDDSAAGVATYLMDFVRGFEIVLLMEDSSQAILETSPLITVAGDSSSRSSCLTNPFPNTNQSNSTNSATMSNNTMPVASKAVIIGTATGGGFIVLIGLTMFFFVIRERRRRRFAQPEDFDFPVTKQTSRDDEKAGLRGRGPSQQAIHGAQVSRNPIPTFEPRESLASWSQVIPEDQRFPASQKSQNMTEIPLRSANRLSIKLLDIERMLNTAASQPEYSASRKNSDAAVLAGSVHRSPLTAPGPVLLRAERTNRHLRNPSDVPAGPDSMTFSAYSFKFEST